MIELDGSAGEGGGQILRSALSLSICTGQAFSIRNIRAKRSKPGLLRQHLTAVRAAAQISGAEVRGDEVGSAALSFHPVRLQPGEYSFAIGTAGSCTLVLQTLLPPLLTAGAPSRLRISGGTHNKGAPPFDFLERAFVPLINRMGPRVRLQLVRPGFYPRGGGEIVVDVDPSARLQALHVPARGARVNSYAESYIAALPLHVAQRELETVGRMLNWEPQQLHVRGLAGEVGPGNLLSITLESEHVTEVFTGFGEKGVSAEAVANAAVAEARAYLVARAGVGPHLADQLLVPMALAGSGSFVATASTAHLTTNVDVVSKFTGQAIRLEPVDGEIGVRVGA